MSEPTPEQLKATIERMVDMMEKMITLLEKMTTTTELQGKLLRMLVEKTKK